MGRLGRLELQWQSDRLLGAYDRYKNGKSHLFSVPMIQTHSAATPPRNSASQRRIRINIVLVVLASSDHSAVLLSSHASREQTQSFPGVNNLRVESMEE